jgi:hypothetical protein
VTERRNPVDPSMKIIDRELQLAERAFFAAARRFEEKLEKALTDPKVGQRYLLHDRMEMLMVVRSFAGDSLMSVYWPAPESAKESP